MSAPTISARSAAPGSRAVTKGKGQEWGLSLYAAVIVKYRDDKTDLSTALEQIVRER